MPELSTQSLAKLLKLLECQQATNNALQELVLQMSERQVTIERNTTRRRRAKMEIKR